MHFRLTLMRSRILAPLAVLVMLLVAALPGAAFANADSQGFYVQTNLVSDIVGAPPQITDGDLVNPWGLVHGPATPWWVADNGAGVSTLYNTQSVPAVKVPLTVTIPVPEGSPAGTTAAPTGVIFNGSGGFNDAGMPIVGSLSITPADVTLDINNAGPPAIFTVVLGDGSQVKAAVFRGGYALAPATDPPLDAREIVAVEAAAE